MKLKTISDLCPSEPFEITMWLEEQMWCQEANQNITRALRLLCGLDNSERNGLGKRCLPCRPGDPSPVLGVHGKVGENQLHKKKWHLTSANMWKYTHQELGFHLLEHLFLPIFSVASCHRLQPYKLRIMFKPSLPLIVLSQQLEFWRVHWLSLSSVSSYAAT